MKGVLSSLILYMYIIVKWKLIISFVEGNETTDRDEKKYHRF